VGSTSGCAAIRRRQTKGPNREARKSGPGLELRMLLNTEPSSKSRRATHGSTDRESNDQAASGGVHVVP
jgi:hypothetical protein